MPLIHDSWMRLKPNEIEGRRESFDDYYPRILKKKDFNHIPEEVFWQWIHAHHDDPYTLKNYAWLDYEKVRFDLVQWSTSAFKNIYVIESFRPYVSGRAEMKDMSQFQGLPEDFSAWKEKGTWNMPPVILDLRSSKTEFPTWSELHRPFQLVEGHSRYGYFLSAMSQARTKKLAIAPRHWIYLMRVE